MRVIYSRDTVEFCPLFCHPLVASTICFKPLAMDKYLLVYRFHENILKFSCGMYYFHHRWSRSLLQRLHMWYDSSIITTPYYTAGSVSGQDEVNPVF